jgi:hypothetical protein
MYDVIGDIHGHADALRRLLLELGYGEGPGGWRHAERQVVFLGDFVDRGPEIRAVLEIARAMVESGAAQAVMGNHEFNAVSFHMPHPVVNAGFLRERSYRNIRQYRETVAQLTDAELVEATRWFQTLPMWLDLGGLRIVHACWDPDAMEVVEEGRERYGGFTNEFFHRACERDEALFDAVEVLLKGKEARLPDGVSFGDNDGHQRCAVRTKWYADPRQGSGTYRDYAFNFRVRERNRIPEVPLTKETLEGARPYPAGDPPVLFGHYWMPGELPPAPLTANAACLDYSVARGGRLCAYRWNGESTLHADAFVSVPG